MQQLLLQQRVGMASEPERQTTSDHHQQVHGPSAIKLSPSLSNLPTDDEIAAHREKYAKYFRMLRIGMPRDMVENAMQRENIDPVELDGPHLVVVTSTDAPTVPVNSSRSSSSPQMAVKKSIRKRLHWEVKVVDASVDQAERCVWRCSEHVQVSQESSMLMDRLFVKPVVALAKESKEKGKTRTISLIEAKKAQNIAITLARVNLSFPALIQELVSMNPSVLCSTKLQSLLDMWPDRKELEVIDGFTGDPSLLGTAEQFFFEASRIPRFREKVACLIFKQEFPARVFELREAATLLIRGINQVCSSGALRRVFLYILRSGILLNVGVEATSSTAGAASTCIHGFALSSLAKVAQTKAFVGGITFLQYIVQCIERDCPQAAHFDREIHLIASCSNVSIPRLLAEKLSLDAGWEALVQEAQFGVQSIRPTASTISHDAIEGVVGADKADVDGVAVNVLATSILQHFATEVDIELVAIQAHLDQLMESRQRFLDYFQEQDAQEELDVLLGHLARFTDEFTLEHKRASETKRVIEKVVAGSGGRHQRTSSTDKPGYAPRSWIPMSAPTPHGDAAQISTTRCA